MCELGKKVYNTLGLDHMGHVNARKEHGNYTNKSFSSFEEAEENFNFFLKDFAEHRKKIKSQLRMEKGGEITDKELFVESL